jgi:hypothetical protein
LTVTWLLVEDVLVIEDGIGGLHELGRQLPHSRLEYELPGPV